jgi:PAS domain-containing protein
VHEPERGPVAIVIERARPAEPNSRAGASPTAETDLSDADLDRWRAELLDPDSWGEILLRYGRATRLAVALTGVDGHLLGPCHNPQPVWNLVRQSATVLVPEPAPACPFCLVPDPPCDAVAAAWESGAAVFVNDPAGLAHMAIPLFLGRQRLGVLIAGQTFAQYPEQWALRSLATRMGVSQNDLWHAAIHQVPISRATLRRYADLLASLGQAFLRQRYAGILARDLHETSLRYRFMIDGSKDHALFTVDAAGCIISWNPGATRLLERPERANEKANAVGLCARHGLGRCCIRSEH